MQGINISQLRAHALSDTGFPVFLDSETGFWVKADGVDADTLTYQIRKTGDEIQDIPEAAFPFSFEITLEQASKETGLSIKTLWQAAKESRLEACRVGHQWVTTKKALDRAIEDGGLRPR